MSKILAHVIWLLVFILFKFNFPTFPEFRFHTKINLKNVIQSCANKMLISLAELNPQEDEVMWCHRLKCLSWDNACCFAYLKTMYTASSKLVLHYEHVHVMSVIGDLFPPWICLF